MRYDILYVDFSARQYLEYHPEALSDLVAEKTPLACVYDTNGGMNRVCADVEPAQCIERSSHCSLILR